VYFSEIEHLAQLIAELLLILEMYLY